MVKSTIALLESNKALLIKAFHQEINVSISLLVLLLILWLLVLLALHVVLLLLRLMPLLLLVLVVVVLLMIAVSLLVVVVTLIVVVHVAVLLLLLLKLGLGYLLYGVISICRIERNCTDLHVDMCNLPDLVQLIVIMLIVECDACSYFASTSSSTSSMNIAIDILGWLNLNDQTQIWNINTTGCYISCYKDLNCSLSESSQSLFS